MAGAMLLPRKMQEQEKRQLGWAAATTGRRSTTARWTDTSCCWGGGGTRLGLEGATVFCWFSRQSLCIFIGRWYGAARLFENKTPTGKISRPIKISVVTACDFDWSRDFLALK